jgi:hypothetical protein
VNTTKVKFETMYIYYWPYLQLCTCAGKKWWRQSPHKLTEADQIPEWLTVGVTFLIPKNENTENPKNYRPVTRLPTAYKLYLL